MINKVKKFCRQKELLRRGDRVLVGLSGGADSVCLFLILLELAKEWNLTLLPVHIHHGIRGEEAERDVAFCEALCKEYGLECRVYRVFVPELAKQHGWTLEEAGRNARYRIFSEWKENGRCDRIAVAHHKNDQAETVLFQMFRGSRLKGLAGMEAVHGAVIRPLLEVSREEIEEYLKEKDQDFCIDSTNFEEEYTRNIIRHSILPSAQNIQPQAVQHIAETAEYLGRVDVFLEKLSTELYQKAVAIPQKEGEPWRLSVELLSAADSLLAERVVYRVLCQAAGGKKDITSGYVRDCMELLTKQTGRRVEFLGGVSAKKNYGELWIGRDGGVPETVCFEISGFPFEKVLPDGRVLRIFLEENKQKEGFIPKSTCTKWFDYDKIRGIVALRTLLEEDQMVLYTDGRGKRAAEVLKDAKVPVEERRKKWLLAADNQILWIPGIRGSEAYRITKETKVILVATIDGGTEHGR